ncbi:peptide/nickel transport system substrate-binding protein/oligopeptide transport system substrate-binding protein [Novosphingobium chloroacetimidivorans]|uniref:Peptide/nickel transport system substrate-binding protein/oligopeptide transport system substrate-binding protein n=1 Tax=Novosphingobium chloroacetimidivorans TaxID=1428314 RepID=A0A7W7K9K5_9SPHN|nr:ABC transporter substrate-binding protein [Novosphingobium chloroacetimidivorans]MBB4858048.1 peptide/nickel transport system substrate-binding protein/oligopeptide transport system substrate-binding protein [Novosphingobium chloroacetimidivorans]
MLATRYVPAPFKARRHLAALTLLGAALAMLPGCGSNDRSRFALAVIASADDTLQDGIDRPLARQLTRSAVAEGLVAFDEQGRVVPALADRWIVTDDGQSYIFRLRDGEWRDGDPLIAKSAKDALDAAIRAQRGRPLELDLATIDEIRVMAGRVIEVRLFRPMPYFLQLMAQPELGLLRGKQGDGPMTVERQGDVARFTPIEPSRLGLPEVPDWDLRVRQLEMTELPAARAVERFNEGEVDMVLGGRIQDFPLTSSVGILRGTIQLDPVIGLFGLQVARGSGFLGDPRNREALALAIDRPGLIAPFGVSGWTPSTRLVSPGLEGDLQTNGERWTDEPIEQRRATAAARVREWMDGADDGEARAAKVSIWLPAGPGSDVLFQRIASDFRTIGVSSERAKSFAEADLRLVDDVARFPRARWFLNRLSCAARRGLCDPEVDAIVAQAARVVDASQRSAVLGEAEARLTQANLFIPFGTPIRWSLVRGNVAGFAPNAYAWHPLMPLAWLPK